MLFIINITDKLSDSDYKLDYTEDKITLSVDIKTGNITSKLLDLEKIIEFLEFGKVQYKDEVVDFIECNINDLLYKADYLSFDFRECDFNYYVKLNPVVLTKNILLPAAVDICDINEIDKLYSIFHKMPCNCYIELKDYNTLYSLSDCHLLLDTIKAQADYIKSLKLSPMETTMYVYDYVRSIKYVENIEDDNLFNKLLGTELDDLGLANLFSILMHYVDIDGQRIVLEDDEENKQYGNILYIVDPKYNIDGVYYFDPVTDSKEHRYDYKNFAVTRSDMRIQKGLIDANSSRYSTDIFDILKEALVYEDNYTLRLYLNELVYMGKLVHDDFLSDSIYFKAEGDSQLQSRLFDILDDVEKKFTTRLTAEQLIRVFNKVRKVQHNEDRNYPYTIEELYDIYISSNWKFDHRHDGLIENLPYGDTNFDAFVEQEGIDKEMIQVKVTEGLQKVLIDKKSNE